MKAHERWWQDNGEAQADQLTGWLEGSDPSSRAFVAGMAQQLHDTGRLPLGVLECGPGVFTDYVRHWSQKPTIPYRAIDVTPRIVERGTVLGLDIRLGSVEEIPMADKSVSLAYCRHVVEHLPHYRAAVLELVRVAQEAAVVVFFRLNVDTDADDIAFDTVAEARGLFHNTYSRRGISSWLDSLRLPYAWTRTAQDWVLTVTPTPYTIVGE